LEELDLTLINQCPFEAGGSPTCFKDFFFFDFLIVLMAGEFIIKFACFSL